MSGLLIVDSHGIYRAGLRSTIKRARPDLRILEAASYDELIVNLLKHHIKAAIIDTQTAGLSSLDEIHVIRHAYPCTNFALMSSNAQKVDVFSALACGLSGFILKSQDDEEIVEAVGTILSGLTYVPPLRGEGTRPDALLASVRSPQMIAAPAVNAAEIRKLTRRQRDVLVLIADGLPNKEIARRLQISEATTKIHVGALMRALSVRNRTEAALLVQAMSYGDADPRSRSLGAQAQQRLCRT